MKDKIFDYLSETPYWELLLHVFLATILFIFIIIILIVLDKIGFLIPFIITSVLILGGKWIVKDYERRVREEYEKDFENER